MRKGEVRDSFTRISALNNKKQNKDFSINNLNKNSKIKIKFDIDDEKTS